jgi:molybdopterin-containing oxidoreductase family iron-sulfur binding subunit
VKESAVVDPLSSIFDPRLLSDTRMLDACPHHHEEPQAADDALDGINMRAPGQSKISSSKKVWRTLDELAGTKSFETMLHREFPHAASEWKDGPSRRNFLKLMSASLAFAGLSACTLRKTEEKIVPYVNAPEDVIPGRPLFFASTMPWCGFGKGVVVESHEGRPTKIEGNADHPASLGSSDIWMQASVLELYDPDRSQMVLHGKDPSSWGAFTTAMAVEMARKTDTQGAGMRFLSGTVTSPTQARLIKALLAKYPQAKWHQHEPVGRGNAKAGAILAFGTDVETVYKFYDFVKDEIVADVVVALDSNFLVDGPGSIAYSRQFIAGRKIRQGDGDLKMNRLYVVESGVTVTGAQSDHRLAIKSSDIAAVAADLLAALTGGTPAGKNAKWAKIVAKDLQASAGRSLVVVGESQPPAVHAIAHAINAKLGNVGNTLTYIDPVEVPAESLEDLAAEMDAGLVDTLFVIGTNPSYTAPRSLGFANGLNEPTADERTYAFQKNPLSKVRLIVHHGLYAGDNEETAGLSHWHIPASHYLESWGDLRAFDGTASIVQPLIYPLYTTKSEIELLGFLLGDGSRTAYDLVQDTWTKEGPKLSDDDWSRALEKGAIPGTAFAAKTVAIKPTAVPATPTTEPADNGLEIVFKTDPTVYDGRCANSGWLQELPKPITLLTWDNAALMSVTTAAKLQVSQADQGKGVEVPKVELTVNGIKLLIPALIMPGHADDSITVYLGYGRTRAGRVGALLGFDAYAVRSTSDTWFTLGVDAVARQEESYSLATSQSHHLIDLPADTSKRLDYNFIEGRELIRKYDLAELTPKEMAPTLPKSHRRIALEIHKEETGVRLLPEWKYDYNKWGMVIDNQACIGCNACVIACQSENNIAIVGKEQVLRGREMHWIRIDTYFLGEPDGSVEVFNQPIPCMQCENAPCELVCPVEATTTSAEGINEMTYNRCVGTRYCSNNCPYKVRRFNFLQYTDYETAQVQLQRNPNVTVRARGVMEKCNFCVQRVNNSRIEAKKQDRPINPGEVVTACAQACPTKAISFGNLNDPRWEVTGLQDEPLRYTLLDELNALPRVSYLGRVKNPNPEMTA